MRAVDTQLTTASFTPRLKLDAEVGELRLRSLGGVDYYNAVYGSNRPLFLGAAPIHRYDLTQTSLAAYWMQTVTVFGNTDIGFERIARDSSEYYVVGFRARTTGAGRLQTVEVRSSRADVVLRAP